jgi:DNA-binding beta-propeller fold protein YncE
MYRLLIMLAASLFLGGCAETKYLMRVDPEAHTGVAAPVWPAAPETPRYRYVGQLIGAQNFVPEADGSLGVGMKVLQWLVGMFDGYQEKAVLKRPQSGMVDADGRVYVTDVSNHAVFVFDPARGRLTLWYGAEEGKKFITPIGIAEGPGGQVLVADAELGRVFRLDRDGKPLGSFGKDILVRPTGLARDAQHGRIYVADTHAHDIKVFDDNGELVDTIGHRADDGDGLNFPTHLAFAADKLYVTDGMNARVQIYDTQGRVTGSLGKRGLFIGNFTRPKGVAVDASGVIYIVESFYDTLLMFNSEGQFLMPLGGTGKEVGQFYLPAGVWCDQHGRVYVADMYNGRIVIFQSLGGA